MAEVSPPPRSGGGSRQRHSPGPQSPGPHPEWRVMISTQSAPSLQLGAPKAPATSPMPAKPRKQLPQIRASTGALARSGGSLPSLETAGAATRLMLSSYDSAMALYGDLNTLDSFPAGSGFLSQPRKSSLGPPRPHARRLLEGAESLAGELQEGAGMGPEGPKAGPKPRLLQELETYVERELGLLKAAPDQPSEARLQVYSEAFECFIENFRTYKPVLATIKREYDGLLANYQQQLRLMLPVQAKLATLKEETLFLVNRMKAEYEGRIARLQGQLEEKGRALEATELRALEAERTVEKLRHDIERLQDEGREAFESNKILAAALKHYKESASSTDDWHGRYDQAAARLRETEEKLSNVLEQQEQAQAAQAALHADLAKSRERADDLQAESGVMQGLYREALARIAALAKEKEEAPPAGPAEPPHAPGVPAALRRILEGTSALPTGALVTRLVAELQKLQHEVKHLTQKMPCDDAFIPALGTGPEVPEFLRAEGKIKNRRLPKGEVEGIIKAIWKFKAAQKKKEPLSASILAYLLSKHRTHAAAVEWGYNLFDSVKRYTYDADVDVFFKILIGEVEEEVHLASMAMLDELHAHLVKWDPNTGPSQFVDTGGKMSKEHFASVLRKFFPAKDEARFQGLLDALEGDQPGPVVLYRKLFEEDKEGNQTAFIETVRAQHLEEREEYIRDVQEALAEADPGTGSLTAGSIRETMLRTDPEHPLKELDVLVTRIFLKEAGGRLEGVSGKAGRVPDSLTIPVAAFVQRFKREAVKRHTRKPDPAPSAPPPAPGPAPAPAAPAPAPPPPPS
eukprot:tig00000622_g2631.t1